MSVTEIGRISKSQANQRCGRAGRTCPGVCYRVYTEDEWQQMEEFKISEIRRSNMDMVVLRLK